MRRLLPTDKSRLGQLYADQADALAIGVMVDDQRDGALPRRAVELHDVGSGDGDVCLDLDRNVVGEIKEKLAKLLNRLNWADARHSVPHDEEGKGRSRHRCLGASAVRPMPLTHALLWAQWKARAAAGLGALILINSAARALQLHVFTVAPLRPLGALNGCTVVFD